MINLPTMNWVRKMMHFMSLHYVKTNYIKVPYELITKKVQCERAFIDAQLLCRRKTVQKSTVRCKLAEIILCYRSLVKFPPENNDSVLKDNFRGPSRASESLPIQTSDHMSIPECSISRNGPAVSYTAK